MIEDELRDNPFRPDQHARLTGAVSIHVEYTTRMVDATHGLEDVVLDSDRTEDRTEEQPDDPNPRTDRRTLSI